MSEVTEQTTIFKKVKEFWDIPTMGSLKYPNLNWPDSPDGVKARTTVTINHPQDGREAIDIGGRNHFSNGILLFTVHMPAESGTLAAKRIFDGLQETFDNLVLTTSDGDIIKFGSVSTQDLGEKNSTYRQSAIIRFRRQEAR